jgi:hypothetical protein
MRKLFGFSSTAERTFGPSFLLLKQVLFWALLGIIVLIAVDKIGFQDCG